MKNLIIALMICIMFIFGVLIESGCRKFWEESKTSEFELRIDQDILIANFEGLLIYENSGNVFCVDMLD